MLAQLLDWLGGRAGPGGQRCGAGGAATGAR